MALPLLAYDGDCGFCRFCVDYWAKLTRDRIRYAPFKEIAAQFPDIPIEKFQAAVQLIQPDGSRSSAAEAVFRVLACVPGYGWLLWLYQRAPGFAPASELAYRIVAAHRPFFDKLRRLFWGRTLDPPTHFLTRWVFLRLLGIVYLAAFASLWPQISGLIGVHGILPASSFFAMVTHAIGAERYRLLPTLAWFNSGNRFLEFLAGAGTLLSVLLIAGIASGPVLLVLWVFYLSLVTAGQDFLSFQWDILLLEAGFLAIFLAPWRPPLPRWRFDTADPVPSGGAAKRDTASPARSPSKAVVWLLRWLLFRLMFLSGCVKLLSHDPNWRNLTALEYHYETQPLPTPVAWYAYQLPAWFQKVSVVGVFIIEIFVPFLIFTPRRIRFAGCAILVFFQVLIAATGNYAFFNLLAITLCVLLLDDQLLRRALPRLLTRRLPSSFMPLRRPFAKRLGLAVLTVAILFGSLDLVAGVLFGPRSAPQWTNEAAAWLEPFHIISTYGLFAVMTTTRPEIIIQGSNDGVSWRDYEFKYKPEHLNRAPRWVAPYQPRLDWQMWFAALGSYRNTPWFENLMARLLEGSKPVLGLLGRNPFPNAPPRYIRALVYDYTFTSFRERRKTGDWWQRKRLGLYFPVAALRQ
jgi:predicted DCC family thiol-disulfide oxidoreductase YuxK